MTKKTLGILQAGRTPEELSTVLGIRLLPKQWVARLKSSTAAGR